MKPEISLDTGPADTEPTWKQRAVERSTRATKQRAEQRVQRFLDAAQALMADKGTTDLTVQEVVDRSGQSLRSFYQHFDGKHELLLALFEDALSRTGDALRAATSRPGAAEAPVARLEAATRLLFTMCRPGPGDLHPLFSEFAPQLLLTHPDEVRLAHAPVLGILAELMEGVDAAGGLRSGMRPRRAAAMLMQTTMFLSQSAIGVNPDGPAPRPLTADEVWAFCSGGFGART
ncbi:TetR/AcrR family transcriptional regulator [Streptomyces sp. NBC_01352]|uniref:TetR/AcrR family transcriptional regulator n=1 Tax=unclassified Streptomyces TaxID=2593676 RepID=UPI0022556F42|nr:MULTISPECIES: TetR/AcrR family transcriptional regulator [unclassified Streptomyces]MCX4704262.1 TetR/AcrR family transcriptional regulator [Streptomyces sp. NBC_01373]